MTHSTAHHLVAIHDLFKTNGYARGIDIAKHLNISRSSVSTKLRELKRKGQIVEDHNRFCSLTTTGLQIINTVFSRKRILKVFFKEVLQLPEDVSEVDTDKIEHLIIHDTSKKLMSFVGWFLSRKKEAVDFRKVFQDFNYAYQTTGGDCVVCETECYFTGKNSLYPNKN